MSAIDQLRVKDVDIMYRARNRANMKEEEKKVALPHLRPANLNNLTILPNSSAATKFISTMTSTGNQMNIVTTLPKNIDPSGLANIRILDARSLTTAPATTSILNVPKTIKVPVKESTTPLSNEKSVSEFIATTLINQPDAMPVKNPTKPGTTESATKDTCDSDSDIEIIEEYSIVPENSKDQVIFTEFFINEGIFFFLIIPLIFFI